MVEEELRAKVTRSTSVLDPRKADAAYKPFPSFNHWVGGANVDTARWDRYMTRVPSPEDVGQDVLSRALDNAKRAAAVEGSDKLRYYAILHAGPVKSAADAVRAAIVQEYQGRR